MTIERLEKDIENIVNDREMDKSKVIEVLTNKLNEQLEDLQRSIASVSESIKGEEKSSAGDKYETARAMNHIELDRLNNLYGNLIKNGTMLKGISSKEKHSSVRLGSLVKTSSRYLFFCGGMGKVIIGDVNILTMSMGSPIGQLFLGKSIRDEVTFNKSTEIIEDIQ